MEGTTSKNAKLLATAGFLFITMIWGGSFVVMKNSVDLVPPSYLLALRFTLAAAFMALAFPGRMKKLDRGSLTCGLIMGIFLTLAYLLENLRSRQPASLEVMAMFRAAKSCSAMASRKKA